MNRHTARDRVVRDFARLALTGSLSGEAESAILEAAIKGEVTISEMLRQAAFLEAGLSNEQLGFVTGDSENQLVPIPCPS